MSKIWYEEQLLTIAKTLNGQDVFWALGGSSLLYYTGLDVNPRDLDIVIDLQDIEVAHQLLIGLGAVPQKDPHENDGTYLTEKFYIFDWNGLEIDLMANPGVCKDKGIYHFRFNKGMERDVKHLMGVELYLSSIHEWAVYYDYLDRPQRVAMINEYITRIES